MTPEMRARLFPKIAEMAGKPLASGTKILDFGCGDGVKLLEMRRQGYAAFGMDVWERQATSLKKLHDEGLVNEDEGQIVRIVSLDDYKVPFDDSSFEFIYSDHVMEHVQNLDEVFAETRRVLKPGGLVVHLFPSRWRLFEAHTKTPFGGAVRDINWVGFWGNVRCPERFKPMSGKDRAIGMRSYLESETNYPPIDVILGSARKSFANVELREDLLMRAWGGAAATLSAVPLASSILSKLHVRALVLR